MTTEQYDMPGEQEAPHLARLGLLSEPFTGADGPHFFYSDANREQRLDLMQHLAPYSEVLVVIGAPGAGKTMLLRQFVARAGETWRTAVVSAQAGMSRDEFVAQAAAGFGVQDEPALSADQRRAALVDRLHALRQGAYMPILIVDDAHQLDADVMELILSLCEENDAGHLLSVMLFGTPQLQAALASPALAPLQGRVAHTFDVPPFSEHDTGRYLRHRLRAAGGREDGVFPPEVVAKIHNATGGNPLAINEMAHHQLTAGGGSDGAAARGAAAGAARSAMPGAKAGLDKRWIAAGAAVLAIVGVLLAGRFVDEPPPAEQTAALELPAEPTPESRVQREEAGPSIGQPPSEPIPAEPAPAEPAPGEAAPSEPAPSEPAPSGAAPSGAAPPPEAETPASSAAGAAPAGPAAVPRPATPPPAAPAARAEAGELRQADWVRAQPAGNYTLQLMALAEEQSVRDIARRYKLADAAYFPVRRDGRTLYVLVQGSYPSRAAANGAAKQLPAGLVDGEPWVRGFKALHAELAK